MSGATDIGPVLEAVRRRCNRLLVRRVVLRGAVVASLVVAAGSLVWLPRGEPVPAGWPLGVAVMAAGLCASLMYQGWMDRAGAARFADRRFGLKDGMAAALYLENGCGAAEEMQRRWLAGRLDEVRVEAIGGRYPKGWLAAGAAAFMGAVVLSLLPPSAEVRAAREEERATREAVADSKEELQKLIEELERDIVAVPEVEGLEMDEFRKMVARIEETGIGRRRRGSSPGSSSRCGMRRGRWTSGGMR